MKVFFDTNIFLSFFRLNNEDIDSLRLLVSAANISRFKIVTTPQLREEYERYREKAILDGLSLFSPDKLTVQFPPFVRRQSGYNSVRDALQKLRSELRLLSEELKKTALTRDLAIDDAVNDLFDASLLVAETKEIVDRARLRSEKGNPPGKKKGPFGDAVHWESLLSIAQRSEDLVVVSRDGDFESELVKGEAKEYLRHEWEVATNGGNLLLFKSLQEFVAAKAQGVEIGSEFSAEFLVGELERSNSYKRTHEIVELLRSANGLNASLVGRIVDAAFANSQFADIIGDDDIQDFILDLYEGFGSSAVGQDLYELLGGGYT